MSPAFHPSGELLLDYAAGKMSEPTALVVATHIALCGSCRLEVSDYEIVGGALLEQLKPEPLNPGTRERVMSLLDDTVDPTRSMPAEHDRTLPEPLLAYLSADIPAPPWKTIMRGIRQLELRTKSPDTRTQILRVAAGRAMPRHTHEGVEMVCVLAGGFTDEIGHYRRGDFAVSGSDVEHRPVADSGEECVCLVVTEGPLRLTGRVGKILNKCARQ